MSETFKKSSRPTRHTSVMTKPIPDGYTPITPYLVTEGAAKAIDWYTNVFGATVAGRMDGPDGRVAHAELDLGNGRVQLSDPMPDKGLRAPDGTNVVDHSYVLYCDDVDTTFEHATQLGAHVYEEPSTFFTGDRFCSILDPFGHRWAIMTRVEDVQPDEAERRINEWLA